MSQAPVAQRLRLSSRTQVRGIFSLRSFTHVTVTTKAPASCVCASRERGPCACACVCASMFLARQPGESGDEKRVRAQMIRSSTSPGLLHARTRELSTHAGAWGWIAPGPFLPAEGLEHRPHQEWSRTPRVSRDSSQLGYELLFVLKIDQLLFRIEQISRRGRTCRYVAVVGKLRSDDDVFYLFLQKQNRSRAPYIPNAASAGEYMEV